MRKLAVTLLAALAVMLPALAVTAPAQASTTPVSAQTSTDPATEPTAEEQAAADQAAADKAAADKAAAEKAAKDKAAKQKAAKEKAAKQRAAKKKAAAQARKKRAQQRALRTWNRLAHCESTSRWHVNTGNGYYGGLQISPSTWRAYGGARFAGLPHHASKGEQIKVGKRIKNGQGWGAWPSCSRKLGLR